MDTTKYWSKVTKTDACWLWTAATTRGYGVITIARRLYYAHRLGWELANGPIPRGKHVLHRCDNPPCVRPDHLFLGTQADNVRDAARKHRMSSGERRPNHKATAADVVRMRELHRQGLNARQMADQFPIGERTIRKILAGRNWKDV